MSRDFRHTNTDLRKAMSNAEAGQVPLGPVPSSRVSALELERQLEAMTGERDYWRNEASRLKQAMRNQMQATQTLIG